MSRLGKVLEFCHAQPLFFVYAIRGIEGHPVYIGRTCSPERRYRMHLAKWGRLARPDLFAWLKAHPSATLEVLDSFHTRREMIDAEQEYIGTLRPRFNVQFNPDAVQHYRGKAKPKMGKVRNYVITLNGI